MTDRDPVPHETIDSAFLGMESHFTPYVEAAYNFANAVKPLGIKGVLDVYPDYSGVNDLRKLTPGLLGEKYDIKDIEGAVKELADSDWFNYIDENTCSTHFHDALENGIDVVQIFSAALRIAIFDGHMGVAQRLNELLAMGTPEESLKAILTREVMGGMSSTMLDLVTPPPSEEQIRD